MVNTYQRQKVLIEAPFYLALKQSFRVVRANYPFTIEAFVPLPDYWHCIWTLPENDADHAVRWNMIKRGVSQPTRNFIAAPLTCPRQRRGEAGLWQR